MQPTAARWEQMYHQTPLVEVPFHFANMRNSPFLQQYLATVLRLCPPSGRACETGIGSGFGAIWLSLRGVHAEGIDFAPGIVERTRQINNLLGGNASFRCGDLFHFYASDAPRYHVVHHQGVLEHFAAPWLRAALAQQVAMADWVVFSVPSVYYPFEPSFGDERLLPLEEWRYLLAPFDVAELKYYGDPQHGEREHILCVLRGQSPSKELLALMSVPEEPYPEGISAIVHTRNEARHIGECLQTLQGWTDEIIVCDMESTDATVEIARQFTDQIVAHPLLQNFDQARNVSAMRARYRWVFYLDADERVPPGLGPALRQLATTQGASFEAVLVPFRHYFTGHWMQCLYPGYTAPRLLKNGKFLFNPRLHSGAQVDGRVVCFPADNPDLALAHYSYDSLAHYLDKLNRYTDGEAANMHRDGKPFHWQNAVRHFVQDFQMYYEGLRADRDSVHGFIYSFLSAFYRFEQHAKLFEHRFRQGQLQPQETVVPVDVAQILEYALSVAKGKPRSQAPAIHIQPDASDAASVVWSGPLLDPSGYGEEGRHLVWAMQEAGVSLAIQPLPWSQDTADMSEAERTQLQEMAARPVIPGFLHIVHNFAPNFLPHAEADLKIGRTIFETDRLPEAWVKACNRMDAVWVATEFNKQTFAAAGVEPNKLAVIPECFDPEPYRKPAPVTPLSEELRGADRFHFLTIFDWTLHKGWDALLRGFLEAFEGRDDVGLILKVWSTMGYSAEQIREQAAAFIQQELGYDLLSDNRIRWVQEPLTRLELIALYQASDAFVLPSRGEGWGRPYMEAMACGLPTLGTNWSGNTAYMNRENSFLADYALVAVPEVGWKEIPTYRGHRWAEPDRDDLKRQMRMVVENREEARMVGKRGQEYVSQYFSREAIGPLIAREITRLQERQRSPLVLADSLQKGRGEAARESNGRKGKSAKTPPAPKASLGVRWEGAFFRWHSLAHVNRAFCQRLLESGQVELSLITTEPNDFTPGDEPQFAALAERMFAPLSQPAAVHLRHFFPPRLDPPDEGRFVLIQPWEYGYLPSAWVPGIQANVDEVWCHSRYVRDVYCNSGIPAEKVHLVPLGVDTEVFTPDALPYIFTTEAGAAALQGAGPQPFVFLFVGGTLHRKGIDILLDAYLKAFSAYDEVCLVIKDTGTETVYKGQNEKERILALTQDATRPRIVYLDADLSAHQLAGLFATADCLVQPYRGEGFCLPPLEAMACGTPAIVTAGGPTDDYIDETVGWRVPAAHCPVPGARIGPWECVGPAWTFEVNPTDLARQMRAVYARPEEARQKGAAAVQRVREHWTWQQATQKALARLEALQKPVRKQPPRVEAVSMPPAKSSSRMVRVPPQVRKGSAPAPVVRKPPTISLCMIVKNEERVLDDCLSSVKPWVDEIIVIDTGSKDRTLAIAQEHGAKLGYFAWCDDFSAARNASLKKATGDWIFWMDADDTLPEACGRQMREVIALAEERTTGFLMQVHIPPAPGDTGFTVVDHVKLFRNRPELRFIGRIHEQILEPIYKSGGKIERTDLYVVHSGYDYSPEGQQHKRERDLRILEKELAERPDHPFVLFNIGMTFHHLKEFDKAIAALERCLTVTKPHESIVRKVYAMLANCYLEKGDRTRAKERVEQGLALTPRDPELLFRAGILYREIGDLQASVNSYLTLLTAREVGHIDSLDVSMTTYKAHHNLALVYQEMLRWNEAEAHFREAVKYHAGFIPSWLGLGELYLRTRRFEDVKVIAAKVAEMAPEQARQLQNRLMMVAGSSA